MAKVNAELVAHNLYSGWVGSGKRNLVREAVEHSKKKVLIIDDNFQDFREIFEEIFGRGNIIEFFSENYTVACFKKEHNAKHLKNGTAKLKSLIDNCCMVISDLYLFEPHGMEFQSTPQNAENISGYFLNKEIKMLDPMLPVMMFTSSNKVWNYRLFDSYGIDEWVIKVDNIPSEQSDSVITISFFEAFEEGVLNILLKKPYQFLHDVYKNLDRLPPQGLWWDTRNQLRRKEIIAIIAESLIAVKGLLNRKIKYQEIMAQKRKIYENNSYTCSAIISQIGNLVEVIYGLYEDGTNKNADSVEDGINLFLLKNRNLAAHKNWYKDFTIDDVVLAIALVDFSIQLRCARPAYVQQYKRPNRLLVSKECSLFWLIVQFYNLRYKFPDDIKRLLCLRANSYLENVLINSKTREVDVTKLRWFRNVVRNEPYELRQKVNIVKGKAAYAIVERSGLLSVDISIPDL